MARHLEVPAAACIWRDASIFLAGLGLSLRPFPHVFVWGEILPLRLSLDPVPAAGSSNAHPPPLLLEGSLPRPSTLFLSGPGTLTPASFSRHHLLRLGKFLFFFLQDSIQFRNKSASPRTKGSFSDCDVISLSFLESKGHNDLKF